MPLMEWSTLPVWMSQNLMELSDPREARWRPSGLKVTLKTRAVWPLRVRSGAPVETSQRRMV